MDFPPEKKMKRSFGDKWKIFTISLYVIVMVLTTIVLTNKPSFLVDLFGLICSKNYGKYREKLMILMGKVKEA